MNILLFTFGMPIILYINRTFFVFFFKVINISEDQQNMEDESLVTNLRSPPTNMWPPIQAVSQIPWTPQMIRPPLVPPIINAPQQSTIQQWWPAPQPDTRNYESSFVLPVIILNIRYF